MTDEKMSVQRMSAELDIESGQSTCMCGRRQSITLKKLVFK